MHRRPSGGPEDEDVALFKRTGEAKAGQEELTWAGARARMVNSMFSVRLLMDRLATLQPRTGPTRVWLSSAVS